MSVHIYMQNTCSKYCSRSKSSAVTISSSPTTSDISATTLRSIQDKISITVLASFDPSGHAVGDYERNMEPVWEVHAVYLWYELLMRDQYIRTLNVIS